MKALKFITIYGLILLGVLLFGCVSSSSENSQSDVAPAASSSSDFERESQRYADSLASFGELGKWTTNCPSLPNFENHFYVRVVSPGNHEDYSLKLTSQDSFGSGWGSAGDDKDESQGGQCNFGEQQGQNANYLYCMNSPLQLRGPTTDANGNIIPQRRMELIPVFDSRTFVRGEKLAEAPCSGGGICSNAPEVEWYPLHNTTFVAVICRCHEGSGANPVPCK